MPQKKKITPKKAAPVKSKPKTIKIPPQEKTPIESGRPKQHSDMKKVTLTVSHDQIIWLDRLATDIREASRSIIDRGAIIRALIKALESSNLNLTHCANEIEILETITRKLKE